MFVDIKTTNPSPGVGDKFKVSYILKMKLSGGVASISHNGIKMNKPNFDKGFVIIDEGKESSRFGFGGFGSQEMELHKYSFILQAKKKGTFKIQPLTFTINGDNVTSGIFTINVGTGNPNVKIQTSDPNLFARIEVNKKNIYKGEPVTAVYRVYTRYNLFEIEDYDMPMTNGLWKEEIKSGKNGWPQNTKTVNGTPYHVITLKKEVLIPQTTGEIKIKPIKIDARIGRFGFNPGKQKSITSNSPTLKVKALPTPIPNNFSDQVGSNYKVDIQYSTAQLKTNDPLDVKVTISGQGNLKQLSTPQLNFPPDFEVFDPEIKDQVKVSSSGISGKKTFNFLVIPRHRGTYQIPEYTFTYFDVNSKKYKTLTQPGKTIEVQKGENETESNAIAHSSNQQNVEILNSGIRHIKADTTLYAKQGSFYGTWLYWLLLVFPFIIGIISYIFIVIQRNARSDESASKVKNANKNANTRFKKASQLLNENQHLAFYEELYKAITNYCSHKLSIAKANLSKETIIQVLKESQVEETTIQDLIAILSECEMARFSPISHDGAEKTLNNSIQIINKIEQDVKK
jgi:uncharacterized membrane protein